MLASQQSIARKIIFRNHGLLPIMRPDLEFGALAQSGGFFADKLACSKTLATDLQTIFRALKAFLFFDRALSVRKIDAVNPFFHWFVWQYNMTKFTGRTI